MLFRGWTGPHDQWQSELNKADRASLLSLVEELMFYSRHLEREELLLMVRRARKEGKFVNWAKRFNRERNDPTASIDRQIKRLRQQKRKVAGKGRTK